MKKVMIAAAAVAMIASAQAATTDSVKADNKLLSTNAVLTYKISKTTDKWIALSNTVTGVKIDSKKGTGSYKEAKFGKVAKTTWPQIDGIIYYSGNAWTNVQFAAKIEVTDAITNETIKAVFDKMATGFESWTNVNKKVVVDIYDQDIYATALDANGKIKNIKSTGDVKGVKFTTKTYGTSTKASDAVKKFLRKHTK